MSKFTRFNPPAQPQVIVPREVSKELSTESRTPLPPQAITVSAPLPKPEVPRVIVHADRLEFISPKIELMRLHIFVGKVQSKTFEPKRAYVANGMLVIEELGFAISANECLVRF